MVDVAITPVLATMVAIALFLCLSVTTFALQSLRWARTLSWGAILCIGLFSLDDSVKASASDIGLRAVLQVGLSAALIAPTLLTHPIRLPFRSRALDYLILMFVWIMLTLPFALAPLYSAGNTVQAMLALVVSVRIVSLYRHSALLLRDLAFTGVLLSVSAWVSSLGSLGTPGGLAVLLSDGSSTARLYGHLPFIHPNPLAFLSTISLTILLSLRLAAPREWQARFIPNVLLFPAWVILLATVVAAWTRSTTAVLVLTGIGVFVAASRRRPARTVTLSIAAVVSFILLVYNWDMASQILGRFVERGQDVSTLSSLNSRTYWWTTAINEIGVSPTGVGVGLGGHRIAAANLSGVGNLDSTWVALLVNAGFVSVAFFALFWLRIFRAAWNLAWGSRLGSVCVAIVIPAFAVTLYNPSVQDLTYIGVFLLISTLALDRPAGTEGETFWGPFGGASSSVGHVIPRKPRSGLAESGVRHEPVRRID